MSDSRAQTFHRLASLDAFLDEQRQLLTRTQSDLHKLTHLRERAHADPQAFVENMEEELDDPAFRLSDYEPPQRPSNIDWNLFNSLDPSPFSAIPVPGPPPLSAATKQLSPPSELQTFVREASRSILAGFKSFIPPSPEDNHDADADAADEQRLAELVQYGKHANNAQQGVEMDVDEPEPRRRRVGSGLRLKASREVLDPDPGADLSSKGKGKPDAQARIHVDVPAQSLSPLQPRPKRSRKPKLRPDEIYQMRSGAASPAIPLPDEPRFDLPPLPEATFGSDTPMLVERHHEHGSDSESAPGSHEEVDLAPKRARSKRQRKGPSETFNLPWSLSEQHLLEKLLEEIPSGETKRWAKISKAMAGRRTPRQVASRVQKYFEKLKKFGVEPD